MGGSWDWSQEYFTMDDKRSQAVTNAFIHLFDIGLIYRDNLLVNWCCALQTVISDIEVGAGKSFLIVLFSSSVGGV